MYIYFIITAISHSLFLSEMNLYSNLYIYVTQNWRFPHYLETKGKDQGSQLVCNQMNLHHAMNHKSHPTFAIILNLNTTAYIVTNVRNSLHCRGFHTFEHLITSNRITHSGLNYNIHLVELELHIALYLH